MGKDEHDEPPEDLESYELDEALGMAEDLAERLSVDAAEVDGELEEEEEEEYDGPSILDDPIPEPPPRPSLPQLAPYEGPVLHPGVLASRLLAWLALAMAVRHLVDVFGGGLRFWHLIQAMILIWATTLLVFRPRLLMRAFDRLPNSEAVLTRFAPKLRVAVASMVLIGGAQVWAGIFDMIVQGPNAGLAALIIGFFMATPAILEYLFRDTWEGPWPPPVDPWRAAPEPLGRATTELLRREAWLQRAREVSPSIVQVGGLTLLAGWILFWGTGPFANQWLGTQRMEMDLVCEDYTVRDGTDAWEARHVPAVEWSRIKTEPPDCWIDCVHRDWSEQNRKRAGLETLGQLAMEVAPKCCKTCKGQFEKGQTSKTTTCCL